MSNNIPLEPLSDRIVIKLTEPEKKSVGGIILAESKSDKQTRGTVLAVGPGRRSQNGDIIPMSVKVGDEVLFSTYAPESIMLDGQEYIIISEESVLALIK